MLNQYNQNRSLRKKLAVFEDACRNAGLKLTHQRIEIYRELAMASDHPAAETLHQRLKKRIPTISLDTIYRTLATLERYGLIRKVQTPDSQARFEAEMMQHHHLICDKCKQIIDFQWREFDDSPLPDDVADWGRIQYKNIVLHGTCRQCLEQE